jgi:hypothetical protein
MKVNLKMVDIIDLEDRYIRMIIIMKENGEIIYFMDRVNVYSQMDQFKRVFGKIINLLAEIIIIL